MKTIDGILFARMINSGTANLKAHAKEINDLNVFPIPDGDTGDNMLMTMAGGVCKNANSEERLDLAAKRVASGMLLTARGNSGVILSQFFEGVSRGFAGISCADSKMMGEAFCQGVKQAYSAVMTPTEGTILTVLREATEYACQKETETPEAFLFTFIDEAKRSLDRTPSLLPVLKKAGVVDSGAAGMIYIAQGMLGAVKGEDVVDGTISVDNREDPDLDAFSEDSVLEFGYCTELLVRLQTAKTDIASFDMESFTEYLQTVGDSIVAVQNGSIVKLHIHTATPHKVLAYCQLYGEFLKVKIENMSLQHNHAFTGQKDEQQQSRKKYGVVAVASGEGLKEVFRQRGADVIVDGGQSMNPSAEDFIDAFDKVNADVIFVFPNNGNIVLTAHQAANMYAKSEVRVIESTTIGAGYASLAMLDTNSDDTDTIVRDLETAMEGVVTADISHCVRDASMDGIELHMGEYIGFVGKTLLAASADRFMTVCETVDKIGFSAYDVCILICGKSAPCDEALQIEKYIHSHYKGKEVYIVNGGQDVYDYILIIE